MRSTAGWAEISAFGRVVSEAPDLVLGSARASRAVSGAPAENLLAPEKARDGREGVLVHLHIEKRKSGIDESASYLASESIIR